MPFKCLTCNKLGATDAVGCEQADKTKCNVRQVQTIHLAHAKGTGRKVARGQRQVSGPKDRDTKIIMEDLHLCCGSVADRPAYTPVGHAATCLNCLENAKAFEAEQTPSE
jgi:hypothetical protein